MKSKYVASFFIAILTTLSGYYLMSHGEIKVDVSLLIASLVEIAILGIYIIMTSDRTKKTEEIELKNKQKNKNLDTQLSKSKKLFSIVFCISLLMLVIVGLSVAKSDKVPLTLNENINTQTVNVNTDTSKETEIDINSASQKLLESLDGIGEVRAKEIIAHRPYSSNTELMNVMGSKLYEKNKNRIAIE